MEIELRNKDQRIAGTFRIQWCVSLPILVNRKSIRFHGLLSIQRGPTGDEWHIPADDGGQPRVPQGYTGPERRTKQHDKAV